MTGEVGFTLARAAKQQLTNLTRDSAHNCHHLNYLKAHYLSVSGKTPESLQRSTHLLKDKLVSAAENWCTKMCHLDKQFPIKVLDCCKNILYSVRIRGAEPSGKKATATHTGSCGEFGACSVQENQQPPFKMLPSTCTGEKMK